LIFGAISIQLFPSIWRFIRTRVMHPSSSSSVHPYEYCEQPSQSFDLTDTATGKQVPDHSGLIWNRVPFV
jgi:hypothetical protein